ncbi:MAG: hypothetical protein ACYTGH_13265, partial [Planctomycetota bacterium]|jgi:hypothetical protein
MEFHLAYPDETLEELTREADLSRDGTTLTCVDTFTFTAQPHSLEEVFITGCEARVEEGGVRIIPETGEAWMLTVDQPGHFEIRTPEIHPDDYNPKTGPLQQIVFIPKTLSETMRFRFTATLMG